MNYESHTLIEDDCVSYLVGLNYSVISNEVIDDESARSRCNGLDGTYSVGFHVAGIFIILFASLFGVLLPTLSKKIEFLRSNPYIFTACKTAATGVLLSVSTIHLINEAGQSFQEPCIHDAFKNYNAYAFLFALMAALLMQALDLQLAEIAERWMQSKRPDVVVENATPIKMDSSVPWATQASDMEKRRECCEEPLRDGDRPSEAVVSPPHVAQPSSPPSGSGADHHHQHHADIAHHGHQHLIVEVPDDMGQLRRVIAAVCMEFGVTFHSVFVGLDVGLTTDRELKPLLVALVFHQMFEGMAMGSRLVDANFHGSLETILGLVFSFSAPLGMVAASIAVSVSKDAMSGTWFVTMMAILDAFCGGILLYLAFNLVLTDFVADIKMVSVPGAPRRLAKKLGLHAALWFGMLLMALVGKWL